MDVSLFDIVPWTHGYGHSWALRWMLLNHSSARDALLELFLPDGVPPWEVEQITPEFRVGRHRADLHVEARDATGFARRLLVETKVNDVLSESQLRAYCGEDAEVVVYAPGLTGLLNEGNAPVARERWVTGHQITAVLQDLEFPDLVSSYLREVAAQAARMHAARLAVQGVGTGVASIEARGVWDDELEAVAWVAEVAATMRSSGATDVIARNTRHDYGIFWAGSRQSINSTSAVSIENIVVYVDVIASHDGSEYAVALKVGGGDAEARRAVFDTAMLAEPPWGAWRRGQPRSANTFRLWSLDASELSATESAHAALRSAHYLNALAKSASAALTEP